MERAIVETMIDESRLHLLIATPLALSGWAIALWALIGTLGLIEAVYRVFSVRVRGTPASHLPRMLSSTKRGLFSLVISISGASIAPLAPARFRSGLEQVSHLAVVFSATWLILGLWGVFVGLAQRRFDTTPSNNSNARRAVTQLALVRRVVSVAVVVIGGLVALTSLPEVRALGASLLASAGVLGIIAGIAGQSTLGNVIAGLQVAFSDSLRIGDVVVVENEWGTIEEITLTYIVVAIWDERRLVLPVSYFVTNAFENWTRRSAQILGSVLLYVDYTVEVDSLRKEFLSYLASHTLWDKRVGTLQVVDVTELTMQVRALVSARSAGDAWNLRCEVREHLIAYLRDSDPTSIPRGRLEMAAVKGADLGDGVASAPEGDESNPGVGPDGARRRRGLGPDEEPQSGG